MSTRYSIYWHEDEDKNVKIQIFRELADFEMNDIRIEIETPHVVVNVSWPLKDYEAEVLKQTKQTLAEVPWS